MLGAVETTVPRAGTRPDSGRKGGRPLPLATVGLVAVHAVCQILIAWKVVFWPWELKLADLTFGRVLCAAAAGMLFHGDAVHLLKQMAMLLVCGAIVEAKVGSRRLVAAYMIGGLIGSLVCIDLTLGQVRLPADPAPASFYPALGATGGIGGLIGLFALGGHLPGAVGPWPTKVRWMPAAGLARLAGSGAIGVLLAAVFADPNAAAVRQGIPSMLGGYMGGLTGGVLLAMIFEFPTNGAAKPCPVIPTRIRAMFCGRAHASGGQCRLGDATSSASAGRLVRFPH
jgi:membrane associated rhomboid family serine protease